MAVSRGQRSPVQVCDLFLVVHQQHSLCIPENRGHHPACGPHRVSGVSTVTTVLVSLVGSGRPKSHPRLWITGEISLKKGKIVPRLLNLLLIRPKDFWYPASGDLGHLEFVVDLFLRNTPDVSRSHTTGHNSKAGKQIQGSSYMLTSYEPMSHWFN